ncbi:MAG: hypothetical protein HRU19_07670 [Pseudobacteriovorax sp.]|nr:hypothetical protein [Pseudobacteriovorax sp.]
MGSIVKWILKHTLVAAFWVFVLSIQVQGRPLFFLAHSILIDNTLVRNMDRHISELWVEITMTASETYEKISESRDNPEKETF